MVSKGRRRWHVQAMNGFGWLYYTGKGGDHYYGKAREWYQKAADAGNTVNHALTSGCYVKSAWAAPRLQPGG